MNSQVCVDSGIVLKLFLDEDDSHLAIQLLQEWMESGRQLVAPTLYPLEITSVLRKYVHRELISPDYGRDALQEALDIAVFVPEYAGIHMHAWDLAAQLNRPAAYDAHYLALAQHLSCDFWTADRRLYNTAHSHFPWVHCLDEFNSLAIEH